MAMATASEQLEALRRRKAPASQSFTLSVPMARIFEISFVGEALGGKLQRLGLTGRQQRGSAFQRLADLRVDDLPPGDQFADCRNDLLLRGVLVENAARAGLQRGKGPWREEVSSVSCHAGIVSFPRATRSVSVLPLAGRARRTSGTAGVCSA